MKGYLQKTEQGWVVLYDRITMQDPSAEDGILPLHIQNEINILDNKDYFNYYSGKEIEFEIVKLYDDKYGHELTYARLIRKTVDTDENGKPLTYWGGYISEDCEAVKNWDRFVEEKNNELEVEKLAESIYGKGVKEDYEEGFVDGYNKAKENYEVTSSIRELHQYKLGLDDGYNKAKETLYTKQDLIDLVQGLKDYTKESHTILGHDDREANEFVDIFLDYSNYQDNE